MRKGEATNQSILRGGLREASRTGLSQVTIGGLATSIDMSKSGLYAHFGSKERLQLDILDFAADYFRDVVVLPALREPAGLPRIRCIVERWMGWDSESEDALPGGCIFVAAATELDDAPDGPVRDRLAEHHATFQDVLQRIHRSAVVVGDIRDGDSVDFSHTLYALMLGFHFSRRMMRDPLARERTERAIERLLDDQRA